MATRIVVRRPLQLMIVAFLLASALAAGAEEDVYAVMARYGMPRGILPAGVSAYHLGSQGDFTVTLASACDVRAGAQLVRYDTTVTGRISNNTLTGVQGVHAKVLILWVAISAVRRDGDNLYFDAGLVSQKYPVATFSKSPSCI